MTTGEQLPQDQTRLIAAAHAVASWARARRAAWLVERTPAPARATEPAPARATEPTPAPRPAPAFEQAPIAAHVAVSTAPAEHTPYVQSTLTFGTIDENRPSITKLFPRIAAAAALIAGLGFGAKYLLTRPATTTPAPAPAEPIAAPPVVAPRRTGSLKVTSTPAGAQVFVDGRRRGVTPVTIGEVALGRHTVEIQSREGTIRRTVTVTAGATADIDEAIYSGWVTVYAPFDVKVSENGRALVADERSQIMLRPGTHALQITNTTLGFDETRDVEVTPGQVTTVDITPAKSPVTVTASEPGEVWIDGTRAGDTPLSGFPVSLGTHDIVVKRAAGGERQVSVTVTTKPLAVNVDFSKPGA